MASSFKFFILTSAFLVLVVAVLRILAAENWDAILDGELDTSNWINLNDMNFEFKKDGAKPAKKILKQGKPPKIESPVESPTKEEEPKEVKIEEPSKTSVITITNDTKSKCNCGVTPSLEETFTLRRVRLILKLLQLDDDVDVEVVGNGVRRFDAKIELTSAQILQLQKFLASQGSKQMNQKEYVGRLHDVNAILDSLIVGAYPEEELDFSGMVEDYTNKMKYYLPSTQDLFWAILIGGGLGLVYLMWVGLPLWQWFFLILTLSSVWHWGHMYKKAMLKKHVALMSSSHIPAECFKEKSWWNFISGSNQKCLEYHEALLVDPLWEVTPTMAVAETIVVFILQPMEQIGHHLGKFFKALVSDQSWFTFIPVLIFGFALFFLLAIMIFKYKVRLPFLMASIEPHTQPDRQSARQVLVLEQKVQELTLKLESQAASAAQSRQPTSEVDQPSSRAITCQDQTQVIELKQKICELETAMKELKITKVPTSDVAEVVALEATGAAGIEAAKITLEATEIVSLEASVELAPEDVKDAATVLDGKLEDLEPKDVPSGDEELVKDPIREDFEWVNTSA